MSKNSQDSDLGTYTKKFNQAVDKRQWSIIRERIVPRIMPPLMVGAAFSTSVFLNLWEHLPPQGRMIGVLAFAGAALASPFINRVGSPIVSRKDAIRAIDADIGKEYDAPARDFSDTIIEGNKSTNSAFWDEHKKDIWARWGDQIANQKTTTGFGPYYRGENKIRAPLHMALAFTAACLYPVFGDNLQNNWDVAMDWTAPPPPLVYTATITPPDRIEGLQVYTDLMIRNAMTAGRTIQPHERSMLSIITYDRPANVMVNGEVLEPVTPEASETDRRPSASDSITYTYQIELGIDAQTVTIDEYSFNLDVRDDRAPIVTINRVEPDRNSPTNLQLDYSIADDYGATGADARIGIRSEDGRTISPVLDSNALPSLSLPFR